MQCRFSSQSLGIYSFPSSFSLFFLLIFTPFSKAKPDFEIAPKKTLATGGYPIDFCTWSWGGFTTGSRVGIMLYMLHVVFQGENTSNMNSNESCVCSFSTSILFTSSILFFEGLVSLVLHLGNSFSPKKSRNRWWMGWDSLSRIAPPIFVVSDDPLSREFRDHDGTIPSFWWKITSSFFCTTGSFPAQVFLNHYSCFFTRSNRSFFLLTSWRWFFSQ